MIELDVLESMLSSHLDLVFLEKVDSTNEYSKTLISKGVTRNTVIIAKEQTKGKGTKGRSFYSPSMTGIYMSYILCNKGSIKELIPVTPAAAVAVTRAIEKCCNIFPSIKWVNDIELDGKKVCGILTESVYDISDNSTKIIIGIGINVTTDEFPDEIKDKAAALSSFNKVVDINKLTSNVIIELDNILESNNLEYMKEYINKCSTINKEIMFTQNNELITGKVVGINEQGHLLLQLDTGIIEIISADYTVIEKEWYIC